MPRKCIGQPGLGRAAVTNSSPDLDDLKQGWQTASVKDQIVKV